MNDRSGAFNPFAAWQSAVQDWSRAFTPPRSAPDPTEAWRDMFNAWTGRGAASAPPDPMKMWQDTAARWSTAMSDAAAGPLANLQQAWQQSMKSWTEQAGRAAEAPPQFEAWLSGMQKWMETASQFVNMGRPSTEFGPFNPFQSFNPFQNAGPAQVWQQLLQHYANAWSEYMAKNGASPPSDDVFRTAERTWLKNLDSVGQELAEAMSGEEFAKKLGISLEQSLAQQEKATAQVADQVNEFLRLFHLPSGLGFDRLFERVIGLEERLDQLEEQNRAILKRMHEWFEGAAV